jgi:putative nucleotidyltransferase with HDIG domain
VTNYLRLLIAIQVAAAGIVLAAALFFFPIRPEIGGPIGLAFWVGLTLIASALPIPLPAGIKVSVGAATVLGSMVLGGPAAAGVVGALGTFDDRELKLQVPWYGTLNNHAQIAGPAALSAMLYEALQGPLSQAGIGHGPASAIGIAVAGIAYNILNNLLAASVVSVRSGQTLSSVWAQDLRVIAPNIVALIPIAWLMAEVFTLPEGVGWWASLLFLVPLFTTRLAYHRYVETRELFEQTIGALANAVDARDRYTRGHSQRVSHIAEAMCRVMKLPESEIEKIKWAGLLHDVGKIGIRDNVLLKPGPLDRHERHLMNQHPTIGAEIVAPARQLAPEAPLIRSHHEWINGSGYPEGLEALDIPLGARILTIADAYEAMTSSRPYRLTPFTHEQAVAELEKFSGIQFDSEIVPILVNLDRDILDRRPDDTNELPTMLHADDPRDTPRGEPDGSGGQESGDKPGIAAATTSADEPQTDGDTQADTGRMSTTPSPQRGSAPRQALASDDVP